MLWEVSLLLMGIDRKGWIGRGSNYMAVARVLMPHSYFLILTLTIHWRSVMKHMGDRGRGSMWEVS